MYTAPKTPIEKLRAYEQELTALYATAVMHRHWEHAREYWTRREDVRRVLREAGAFHEDHLPPMLDETERIPLLAA
jgi:hypothetical protein